VFKVHILTDFGNVRGFLTHFSTIEMVELNQVLSFFEVEKRKYQQNPKLCFFLD